MSKVAYTKFTLEGWKTVNQGQAADMAGKLANAFNEISQGPTCDSVFTYESGVTFCVADDPGSKFSLVKKGWSFQRAWVEFAGETLCDQIRLAYLLLLNDQFPGFQVTMVQTTNSDELHRWAIALAQRVNPGLDVKNSPVFGSSALFEVPEEMDFRA